MDRAAIYRVVSDDDVQPDGWQLVLTTDEWTWVLVAPTGGPRIARGIGRPFRLAADKGHDDQE